jgi:hypothetical protein
MHTFTRCLYSMYAGQINLHVRVKVTARLCVGIRLFRVLILMASRQGVMLSRSMDFFLRHAPLVIAEFSASLTGIRLIWYWREDDNFKLPITYG